MFGNVSDIWVKTISYHLDIVNALEQKQVAFALAAHEYIYRYDIKVLDHLELENSSGDKQ
jgi:hypothetical protein